MEENQFQSNQSQAKTDSGLHQKPKDNKKPVMVAFSVLFLLLAVVGGVFYVLFAGEKDGRQNGTTAGEERILDEQKIISDYGFSLTIPQGWHVWVAPSAYNELINETNFLNDTETVLDALEAGDEVNESMEKRFEVYQTFMDDWAVESSRWITLSNANVDYDNRSLSYAGEIASTLVDSQEMLDFNYVDIIAISDSVPSNVEEISSEKREVRYITIDGKQALLQVGQDDQWKKVKMVIILYPLDLDGNIDGEKVNSLQIVKYVDQDDPNAVRELISFIEKLDISRY